METFTETPVFEIPNRLTSAWVEEVKAIVDHWYSYMITPEQFLEAVLHRGLEHAKANGGVAWIADSSKASGLFIKEQLELIDTKIFPAFVQHGIKYFITIKPEGSVFTEITVKKYSEMAGPNGLQLVEVGSVEQAVSWLMGQEN